MKIIEPLDDLAGIPLHAPGTAPQTPPRIYDTTLRDGEQAPGVAFTPLQKVTIAIALARSGVHIINVGFPASSVSDAEALRLILEARKRGEISRDVEILVMCRALERDIDATAAAVAAAGVSLDCVTLLLFTSASSLHVKYKLGTSLLADAGRLGAELTEIPLSWFHAANADRVAHAIDYAASRGASSIEFGAEDASRTPLPLLIPLVRTAIDHGAKRYIFADTTGVLTPDTTAEYCEGLRRAFPGLPLVAHFHNDFDLATINTVTAFLHGMDILSVTVNGIGERAGNAPLHSVVIALRSLYGVSIPGFQYETLSALSALIAEVSGISLSRHEPIVGLNAFAHESGVHVQGVLANPAMYEAIDPASVGARRMFAFGKHSGVAGVRHVLMQHQDQLGLGSRKIDAQLVTAVVHEIKTKRQADALAASNHRSSEGPFNIMTEIDVIQIAQGILDDRHDNPATSTVAPDVNV